MSEPLASALLTNAMLYFGGPAVVIAIMSSISAYNHWVSRKLLQELLNELRRKEP
jgi:chromate transport protein ChrA